MTDQDKLGLFKDGGSIYVDDEYDKKPYILPRHKGKQMAMQGEIWGKNPDSLIDKNFKRLSENDQYVDPGSLERKERYARRSKNVSEKAFYPPAPAKDSTGSGSHGGCIAAPYEYKHEWEPNELKEMVKEPVVAGPKNFMTAPTKKGSYGTLGTTIGPGQEYLSDTYLNSRVLEKTERVTARERIPKPFVSSGRGGGCFDRNVYEYEPGPQYREKPRARPIEKPFRPPNPPKTGATIAPFPDYMEDPLDIKNKIEREEKAKERPPGIFKPMNVSKSMRNTTVNPYLTAARPPRDNVF